MVLVRKIVRAQSPCSQTSYSGKGSLNHVHTQVLECVPLGKSGRDFYVLFNSFILFSRLNFCPETVNYSAVDIVQRLFFFFFFFFNSTTSNFFFVTVVVRRTISNLSSSFLKFRINNTAKAWSVLLNFNQLQV